MSAQFMRFSAAIVSLLAVTGVAAAQGGPPSPGAFTTGVAPAERPLNNDEQSMAGQVVPSPQDTAAHNAAIFARDQQPTLAHTFNFTAQQKQQVRDALAQDRGQGPDVALTPGTELAQPLDLKPVPEMLAQQMPWIEPYRYVKLGNKIAFVDPNMPVVVAVIE